jgi:hypothetical protein
MKPLRVLIVSVLSLISVHGEAHTLLFKTREVPSPINRTITDVYLGINKDDVKSVSIEFHGKKGLVTNEKWFKRFQNQDSCEKQPCSIFLMSLPLSLEKVSCSIKMKVETNDGKPSTEISQKWGECASVSSKPSERHLADLMVSEDDINLNNFIVNNDGASVINKNITIMAYLLDENKKIIWADTHSSITTIGSNDYLEVIFNKPLLNWQEHLGCNAVIVIDSEYSIHEKKKKNNEISFPYGGCERTPSMAKGDRFDFYPTIEIANSVIKYQVFNSGRMSMLNSFEKLEYEILYFSANESFLFKRSFSVSSPLYGFGNSKEVFNENIPENVCNIVVQTNGNRILKEANFSNNNTIIDICN